jgi:hypothetical protein
VTKRDVFVAVVLVLAMFVIGNLVGCGPVTYGEAPNTSDGE